MILLSCFNTLCILTKMPKNDKKMKNSKNAKKSSSDLACQNRQAPNTYTIQIHDVAESPKIPIQMNHTYEYIQNHRKS